MSRSGRFMTAVASVGMALVTAALWWLAWAAWWPIEPPVVVHGSRAEPITVRAGQTVAMVADAVNTTGSDP